jgi:hypothetical protein
MKKNTIINILKWIGYLITAILGGLGGRIGRPINQFDFNGNLIKT